LFFAVRYGTNKQEKPMTNLSSIRTRLGITNGEGNVSDVSRLATYDELIRTTIDDIRSRQGWSFDLTSLNVAFNSSGVSTTTLTNFTIGSFLDARKVNSGTGDDDVYSLISPWESDKFNSNDYPIWLTGNDVDTWKLNIKDTDSRTLTVSYVAEETALIAGVDTTRIPINAIVFGAYALLLKTDDNEIDNTRELNTYENEILKLKRKDDRYFKRAMSPSELTNYSIGDV